MCYVLGSWDSVQTLSHKSHCPGGRNRQTKFLMRIRLQQQVLNCSLEKQHQPHQELLEMQILVFPRPSEIEILGVDTCDFCINKSSRKFQCSPLGQRWAHRFRGEQMGRPEFRWGQAEGKVERILFPRSCKGLISSLNKRKRERMRLVKEGRFRQSVHQAQRAKNGKTEGRRGDKQSQRRVWRVWVHWSRTFISVSCANCVLETKVYCDVLNRGCPTRAVLKTGYPDLGPAPLSQNICCSSC